MLNFIQQTPPQTFKTTTNKYLHISPLPNASPQVHTNTTHFEVLLLQIKQILLPREQPIAFCSSQSKVSGSWILSLPLADGVGLGISLYGSLPPLSQASPGERARTTSSILGPSPPCLRPAHQDCFKSIPTVEPPFAPLSQMGQKLVWHVFLGKTAVGLLVLRGQHAFTLDRLDGSHQSGML